MKLSEKVYYQLKRVRDNLEYLKDLHANLKVENSFEREFYRGKCEAYSYAIAEITDVMKELEGHGEYSSLCGAYAYTSKGFAGIAEAMEKLAERDE